ncbi:MAG TPA: hypothetical protein VEW25_03065 [Allosphingosinicella sp.]|nr:hypothetical protein [Allosphingosinicella sp.]
MSGIDDILIERIFSPAAGWLEHRLGLGQWRVAIECLNGHVACYLAGVAFAIAGKGTGDGIFVDLLAALLWLGIMEAVRRAAMRQAGSSMGAQTARLGEWRFRCIFLVMLPVSLCYVEGWASGFYTASLALLTAHLYFKACDAPPPGRKRRLAFTRAV